MKQRLLVFIDFKGLSVRKFCDEVGISHSLLGNNSALGSDKLEKISTKYPELNMDWVITGRQPMNFIATNNPLDQVSVKLMMAEVDKAHQMQIDELQAEIEELKKIEPQILVGSDEGARLAIQVQKDTIMELQAKLIKCMEGQGYMPLSMNEAMPKQE